MQPAKEPRSRRFRRRVRAELPQRQRDRLWLQVLDQPHLLLRGVAAHGLGGHLDNQRLPAAGANLGDGFAVNAPIEHVVPPRVADMEVQHGDARGDQVLRAVGEFRGRQRNGRVTLLVQPGAVGRRDHDQRIRHPEGPR